MDAPVTLRLDPDTRRRILRTARRKGITQSEVIRRALHASPELNEMANTPYALMADLLGAVHGGDPRRSENTGKKFRKLLEKKRKP